MNLGKVCVLMGGDSAEREVSLGSGQAVIDALKRKQVNVEGLDAVEGFIPKLIDGKYDRVFIALHGRGGEDGELQGLLELLKLPYTGSGVLASALAMDKYKAKRIWQMMGLSTPPAVVLEEGQDPALTVKSFGLPVCIKPNFEGSSLGVKKLTNFFDLYEVCREVGRYGQVLIEPWIFGDELTVGIVGGAALPPIQIVANDGFYDYTSKYHSTETEYICPAPLTQNEHKMLQRMATEAFNVLGCRHWGRVDFIRDINGDFWLLEVNTIPGLTATSLVPKAAKAVGVEFDDLVFDLLCQTLPEYQSIFSSQSTTVAKEGEDDS